NPYPHPLNLLEIHETSNPSVGRSRTALPSHTTRWPRGWSLCGKTRARPGCAGIVRERLPKDAGRYRAAGSGMREFLRLLSAGVGCRGGLAWAHNPKVAGSNPAPATMNDKGLADAEAASPFRLPRLHPGIGMSAWLRRAAGKRRPRR